MNLLHFVFNLGIALSYLLIPAGLLSIVRRSWFDIPPVFRCTLIRFALFIVSCAIGHFLEAFESMGIAHSSVVLWHGMTLFISASVAIQMPSLAKQAMKFLREHNRLHQELQESDRRFNAFMDYSPAYAWMVDKAGTFLYCDRSYPALLGLNSRDEVIGKTLGQLFPEDVARIYVENNEVVFLTGKLLETIEPAYKPDGTIGKYLIHKFLLGPGLLGGKAIDITEWEQLREDADRANQELEQFAYAASHDLRTPLRGISGLLAILSKKLEGRLTEQEQKLWEQVIKDCAYAIELVGGILEYSRVGRIQGEAEAVDLRVLTQEVCDRLKEEIEGSGARITMPDPVVMRVDRTQFSQVLENLIANAIKYRGINSPEIVVSAAEQGRNWLVSVADNGIGVDPDYQDQLFTMFRRLHGRAEIEGTGIGLAIVRKIAQRHHGEAWLESGGIGQGTTFYVSVPKR